jgi:PAS domain S-box-containing protein
LKRLEHTRLIIQSALDAVIVADGDGRIIDWNPQAEQTFGWTREQVIGALVAETIVPLRHRGAHERGLRRLVASGEGSIVNKRVELAALHRDGHEFPVELTIAPVRLDEAWIFSAFVRDLTEQKRTEEAMARLRRQSELILESVGEGVQGIDLEGRITFENPTAARLLGYAVGELSGRPGHVTMHHTRKDGTPYPCDECLIHSTIHDGNVRRVEDEVFWRKDGSSFPVEYTTAPIRNDRNEITGAVVVFRDMTARKASEERIRRLNRWFAVLSGINSLIVRTRDRDELFRGACRIAVESGALGMAWIGLVDAQTSDLKIVASYGGNERDDDVVILTGQDRIELAQRPAFRALSDGKPVVCNDVETDPSLSTLRTQILRHGYRALACLPLCGNDSPDAVMALFADETGFFDEEQRQVLLDLSANISFALAHMEKEQELQASELRFRQLAENIREVFWLTDQDKKKILYVSPGYEEIWGRTCETLYASPSQWIEAIHPEDRSRVVQATHSPLASGGYDEEFRIVRPDGSIRWIRDRAFPVFRNGTEVYRITGIAEDITAKKRAAQQQQENERQLSDMLANVEMVSMMLDRSARITYSNDYLLHLTGWRREDVMGKDWMELFIPPETEVWGVFATLLDNEPRAWHHENEILTRSGERRLIRWHNSVRRGADGDVVGTASIGEDITEQKLAELEILSLNANLEQRVADRTADLERARAEANQANQAKSSFLAAMSHEIRTPMNGVIGMLDVLQQTNLRADQIEMIDLVRDSAASLLGIIEDILDFSKIEAGKLTIENEPMRLTDVVEKTCGMLNHMAAKKGVHLTLFVDPAIPASMLGDETRLRQVLVNLIGNAIKFSSGREQPGQVSARALLIAEAPGVATVDLVVTDNGIGIDEATLARLFTPYTQADASTTRRFGGTGLGLTISDLLVRLMNGSMSVRSAPGQGSTFSVRFRFQTVEAGPDADDPGVLVHGLHCRVVGPEQPMGDDLAAYLAHAGAIVERSADLTLATSAERSGELKIWVLLPSQRIKSAAEYCALAGGDPDQPAVRFVVLDPDSTHGPRVVAPDIVAMAPAPLFRRTLFKAVALAASSAAVESRPEAPAPAKQAEPAPGLEKVPPRGRLILVAEDNETNRKVILRQLQVIGFAAEVCVDGREALERWRGGDFAMLLTDLNMPEMDGHALARAIREEEPEGQRKPIIALTANALREEELGLRAIGFDGYLCKPVRLAQLRTSIEAWLGKAPPAGTPRLGPVAQPPAVNLDVLSALVGNDAVVIEEVLAAFRESATLTAAEMTRSIAAGSDQATSDAAHKLKSAARAIGAIRLGDLCARIEELAQARKAGEVKSLLPLFKVQWAAVLRNLDQR